MSKIISYIDEKTGSGKTSFLINQIKLFNELYLIVAPSRDLCDEISSRLKDEGVASYVVHQNTAKTPSSELITVVEQCDPSNRVVITTQASFFNAFRMGIPHKDKWNLVFDEDFNLYHEHEIYYSKHTRPIFQKYFKYNKSSQEGLRLVEEKGQSIFNLLHKTEESFLTNDRFRSLVNHVISGSYHTFILDKYYEQIKQPIECDEETRKAYIVSMIDVKELCRFKTVLAIASYFTKTITYKLLEKMDVDLRKMSLVGIQGQPNYNVKIHYYVQKNWSTRLRNMKVNKSSKKVEDLVYGMIEDSLCGESFIYNSNVSFRHKVNGGKLVTSMFGVNTYSKYNNMVYLPSLNATGDLVNFLLKYQLTRKDIDFARNVLTAYQFSSRGAIRNLAYDGVINIHVPDKRTADFLHEVVPNSNIIYEQALSPNKKIPSKVRSFVSRVRKRLESDLPVRPSTIEKYEKYLEDYYK